MTTQELTIEAWINELERIAREKYQCPDVCKDPESWSMYYDDGLDPEEAFIEDMKAGM